MNFLKFVGVKSLTRMTKEGSLVRLASNADVAESRLLELRKDLEEIKSRKICERIAQLKEENTSLKNKIETAKQNLIKLEIANGKKQYPIPSAGINGTQPVTVAEQVEEGVKETNIKKPKEKKEKVVNPKTANSGDSEIPIDVRRLDMRVGKIVEIKKHPDADALYVEQIDCGEPKTRTVVSGLVNHVPIEEMKDRIVIVMCNLKPVKMRGVTSEGMVMCASADKVEVLIPPAGSVPGDLVHCDGYPREPDVQMNPKKKIFETCAPDLATNNKAVACYKGSPLIVPGKGEIVAKTLTNVPVK